MMTMFPIFCVLYVRAALGGSGGWNDPTGHDPIGATLLEFGPICHQLY